MPKRLFEWLFRIPFMRAYAQRQGRKLVPPMLRAGDVCSVRSGREAYAIAKVLARDPGIVHVRIYKEKFQCPPERIRTTQLSLGTIDDTDGFGVGHLPVSEGEFGLWGPVIIGREEISIEELEGHQMWKEAGGGVWE